MNRRQAALIFLPAERGPTPLHQRFAFGTIIAKSTSTRIRTSRFVVWAWIWCQSRRMNSFFPEPEFETGAERCIVALAWDYTMETRGEIPALWHELMNREFEVENIVPGAAFGVSYDHRPDGTFRYGVGFESSRPQKLPDGACLITLAAGTYAVFRKRAPIAELPPLFDHIFQTWLPASDYQKAEGAVFERYPDDPGATMDARVYEIWVPVAAR